MAEEFRYALAVAAVLAMAGLVIHGIWANRKNNEQNQSRYFPDAEQEKSAGEGFDEYGIGKKRKLAPGEKPQPKPTAPTAPKADRLREPVKVRRQEQEPQLNMSAERAEPQMSFSAVDEAEPETSAPQPSEVLILYVLMPEGHDVNGAMLLPSLLTLGFKYGDMNIFHRHEDNAGSGEVLFSLANMFNPGTFDLEDIDAMYTRGLSLFMTLPGPGEALQNFNLMHNAAKKLAEEFGGQVLDGQRNMLTVQTTRHYVERIREFQRQQLLRG